VSSIFSDRFGLGLPNFWEAQAGRVAYRSATWASGEVWTTNAAVGLESSSYCAPMKERRPDARQAPHDEAGEEDPSRRVAALRRRIRAIRATALCDARDKAGEP